MVAILHIVFGLLGIEGFAHIGKLLGQAKLRGHARAGAAARAEDVEIQARLVGLDPTGIDQVTVDKLPVGIAEALGILIQNDLGQVLTQDRCVTGTARMHLGQVHDLHLAVVTEEAAGFSLAREADASFDVLVQVAQHHQRLDQEHRLAVLAWRAQQVAANPAGRAEVLLGNGFFFAVEFTQVELPGVVHQRSHIQGDIRAAATQADQAHGREVLHPPLSVVIVIDRRKHQATQAIKIVEDAIDVTFGEIHILLAVPVQHRRQKRWQCIGLGRGEQVVCQGSQGGFKRRRGGGDSVFFCFHWRQSDG